VVHHLVDVQERITVLDCNVVEFAIVNDRSAGSILFPNKEHQGSDRTVGVSRFSPTSIEHLIEDFSAFHMLFLVHMVWSTWLW